MNFRLRDAIFSSQRYWGEPFPVYYKDNMPYMIDESALPLDCLLYTSILGNKRSADFLGASCLKKTTLAKFLLPASSIAFF